MTLTQDKQWVLESSDYCDVGDCPAQAFVKVVGVVGELIFCSHHYETIMSNDTTKEKMLAFAFKTIDERERLIENRLIGDN